MTREPFRLGPWRVDPGLCEISNADRTLHVEPRTMAVLCHLAEHAGRTVPRDELLDAIWKTRHVVEDVLTRCISQLRQLLGDDARDSRFIQTIPKLGYRLLMTPEPVTAAAAATESPAAPVEAPARPWARWAAALVTVAVVLAGIYLYLFNSRPQVARDSHPGVTVGPDTPCIAILPFVVVGDTYGADAFADGMTDDIIQLLATVPGLRVMSRTSSFHFKDSTADLGTIAAALNVQHVLEGSVQRTGDRIRIKAQLIDARTDLHLWSEEFDRELVDLFEVQKDIAVAVARRLNVSVDRQLVARGVATKDMAAYELFVEGRMAMERYTESAARDSVAMLDAAVKLDPTFASAWSQLAIARWVTPASSPNMTQEQIQASDELARAAASRALELDRSVAGAHFVLADSARVGYAHAEAELRYRAALAAVPNDPSLHVGYGNVLSDAGLIRNSLTHRQLASRLDPLSPVAAFFLARSTLLAGDEDTALDQLRRSRDLGFQNAVLDHMEAYLHARRKNWHAAGAIWAKSDEESERKAMEEVFAALENPARYPQALAAIKNLPPWNVLPFRGRLYAALLLGERDVAFEAALQGIEMRLEPTDIWWLPEAEILRKDERFPELAERLGLLIYWQEYGWPDACSDSRTQLPCG